MPADLKIGRLPLLPLAGLVLALLAVVGALIAQRSQSEANLRVAHTLRVEVGIAEILGVARSIESGHRGYLIAGNPAFRDDMEEAIRNVAVLIDDLARMTGDNPKQQASIARLRRLLATKAAFARQGAALVSDGRRTDAIAAVDQGGGQRIMAAIEARLAQMKAQEDELLNERVRNAAYIVSWVGVGQVAALMLVLAAAALMIRDARRRHAETAQARDEARGTAEILRREMTAREEAEGLVRQMQKMESIGQLTGGIAHDFNNMLAIVIGSLDLAKRRLGQDPERLEKCIDNAREGAERAATLTARLLAFSRQQPLAPVALDANRLVAGMSELLRRTLGEQISVETVLAGGLWRTYADPSQLENAILNLAVNGRDAMSEGGKLTIETNNAHLDDEYARTRSEVEAGQYVLICVTDTGTGMPPEVIERAFDPFFTTKEVGKGTGLGLSQVFGFVKQSGGHVAIYSEPGQGTTVKLYLPRFAGPAAATEDRSAASDTLPLGSSEEIILVVEDEQRVRHFSVDALRELGYTAVSAADAREALEILAEQPRIALLFTDVVMPEMNGRRLADEARLQRPDLKVLYTTGYTRNAVVHNGMLDAGVAFLPKPFTVSQLANKVREVLDGSGSNRSL
jgi:signal transduction histidine kinase/ActR/RegA family two-component response regulator